MHTLPVPLQCTSSDTYQFLKINADCITMWHKALPLDAVEQALVILSANNEIIDKIETKFDLWLHYTDKETRKRKHFFWFVFISGSLFYEHSLFNLYN